MLIHEMADQLCCRRWSALPFALLIGGDQSCLRFQSGQVGWFTRVPEPINERAGTSKLGIAIDQRSRLHPLDSLCAYSVMVRMRSKEPDRENACLILQAGYQAIVVAAHVPKIGTCKYKTKLQIISEGRNLAAGRYSLDRKLGWEV
jgi:hypothetical protein